MTDEAAAALAALRDPAKGASMRTMYVDAVRSDGRVNLRDGDSIVQSVPCLPAYLNRTADDVVIVLRDRGGMVVLGRLGNEQIPQVPDAASISWGNGAPSGGGWVRGVTYVRDGEVYVDTSQTPSSSPSGGGSSSTPRPVTVQPTTRAVWRNGSRESDRPVAQGAWPSYPRPFTGGWFFGAAMQAACAGKTVDTMRVRLGRSSASHGAFGQVRPRLYLVSASSPGGSPPRLDADAVRYGPGLGLGGVSSWTLPDSWASALASGAAGGLVCSAPVGSGYLIFDGSSGAVSVTFD